MEKPFDPKEILDLLSQMDDKARLAFGLSCAERLYPNYLAFHEEQQWGNPEAIRKALDLGWQVLDGESLERSELIKTAGMVDSIIPDADDFCTILVSSAMDAAIAAKRILQFTDNHDVESIAEIASLCRDTIDMYVSGRGSELFETVMSSEQIMIHPLMQEELRRQREDALELVSPTTSPLATNTLRKRWRDQATSNLGLVRTAARIAH